jgi:AraC-like DNA-binding protein
MSIVFRVDDAPAGSRADYWQHVVGDSIAPLELRRPEGLDGADRLRVDDAGAVRVTQLSVGRTGAATRTAAHIRRSDPELLKVDVVARGRGVIAPGEQQAAPASGDFSLVDLSRPCHWELSAAEVVAVVVPRALVPLRSDDATRLSGVRIPGGRGPGALASSLARQLPARLDECDATARARLGTAVIDLLAAALAARIDRASALPEDSRRAALTARVHAFIEGHLHDPELSPRTIAAAQYISVRYLHRLFEAQETTVSDWIRRRRLERCRRDLLDPALRTQPVGSIGARWGLPSASHFSRAFRAAYGLPPAEFRLSSRSPRSAAARRRR